MKKQPHLKGFSLVELLLTMSVFAILLVLTTINFTSVQRKTTLNSTIEALLTDLNQQQIKAMVGDTEGRATTDRYGIRFGANSYTLFSGTYLATASSNFTIELPSVNQFTTTLPNSEILFEKGSGEFVNYAANQSTVTITDTVSSETKVIRFNRYGVVTSVN